jgi:molybdopterin-guanine dinucleotide biosynthesis protein
MSKFRIISVTGAHSKVGKTTLCSILLKNLKGFGAIKFTKTSLYAKIIEDPEIITQKNTDTGIMSEAGAEKVLWIQSTSEKLEDPLNIALGKMAGLKGVVVEGNSPIDYMEPDLIVFIIGDDGRIKPSAVELSKKADMIIMSTPKDIKNPQLPASVPLEKREVFRIDLAKKEGEIDKLIAHIHNIFTDLQL